MSQRSFTNERYRKDAKIGSTRKSAAKAKPIRKQGTVETSSPATKTKPKAKMDFGLPSSPEIKKWRTVWWVLLLSGLALIGGTYLFPQFRTNVTLLNGITAAVFVLSMAAITIDLVVIRRLRKQLIEDAASKKSSKHRDKPAEAKASKSVGPADAKATKTGGSAGTGEKDAT